MATAATHSEADVSKPETDGELIAQIAPPMLDKLKSDGKLYGLIWMLFALIAAREFEVWGTVRGAIGSALHLGPYSLQRISDIGLIVGILAAFLLVPWYFQWRAIKDELKHRRRHGKWRWER